MAAVVASWMSDQNGVSYFWSTSHTYTSHQVSSQVLVQEKLKIDFQNGGHDGYLGFPIGILAILDLQVSPVLTTKFWVNWFFISKESVQYIYFEDGGCDGHLWFLSTRILAIVWSTSHSDTSYQVSHQLAFLFRRSSKQTIKMTAMEASLDFWLELF